MESYLIVGGIALVVMLAAYFVLPTARKAYKKHQRAKKKAAKK